MLSFVVEGRPQPKQRARKGRGGHWYTPEPTKRYVRAVRSIGTLTMAAHVQKHKVPWPLHARYRVKVIVALDKGQRADVDNVAKSVLDALNGALWFDDRQVDSLTTERCALAKGPWTGVHVEVLPCS